MCKSSSELAIQRAIRVWAAALIAICVSSPALAQDGVPPVIAVAASATPGVVGFSTYFFHVTPALGASISAVDGEFFADAAGAMRQVNPFDLPTVLNNNNGAITLIGEDPLADSQFQFQLSDAILIINTMESGTELRATLAGLKSPRTSQFTLAHVVLADGASGTWRIGVLQTDASGVGREFMLFGVFGSNMGALAGDYNVDGMVDAADYVLWRDTLGVAGPGLAADGNANDVIDPGDYGVWRADFGQTATRSAFANSAVPEAASCAMVFIAATAALWSRRYRERSRANRR